MNSVPKVAPKKPYQQPVLRVHGNVETLTALEGTGLLMDTPIVGGKTH